MKGIAFLMVFVPASITLVTAGMLVLGMHSPLTLPAWFLWEVSLSSALGVLVSVSVIALASLLRSSGYMHKAA